MLPVSIHPIATAWRLITFTHQYSVECQYQLLSSSLSTMLSIQTNFPLFLLIMTLPLEKADMQPNRIWLNIQQYNCLHVDSHSLHQIIKQNYLCILRGTLHCIQDTFSYVKPFRLNADSFCGFIDSKNIHGNNVHWTITGKPAIMLNFLHFSLSHSNWKCRQNHRIIVSYSGKENTFCGFRYPWKIHAKIEKLQIKLEADFRATNFQIQFYSFPRIYDTQQLLITQNNLARFSSSHFSRSFDIIYHFYARHRTHNIRTNITHNANHTLTMCYDGPGSFSPALKYNIKSQVKTYLSSAFHMFCVIRKPVLRGRGSEEDKEDEVLIVSYMSQNKTDWNDTCRVQHFNMDLSLVMAQRVYYVDNIKGKRSQMRCSVQVNQSTEDAYSPLLLIAVERFILNREIMLLEAEPCFYGGIFVYGKRLVDKKIGNEWLELMNYCTPNDEDHYNPVFHNDIVDYYISFISFEGYSYQRPQFSLLVTMHALKYIAWEKSTYGKQNANPIRLNLTDPPPPLIGYAFRSDPTHQHKSLHLNFIAPEAERRTVAVRLVVYPEENEYCLTCYFTMKPFYSNYFTSDYTVRNIQANNMFRHDTLLNIDTIVINERNCEFEEFTWTIFVEFLHDYISNNNNASLFQLIKDTHFVKSSLYLSPLERGSKTPVSRWWHILLVRDSNIPSQAIWKMWINSTFQEAKVTFEHIDGEKSYLYNLNRLLHDDNSILLTGISKCNIFFQYHDVRHSIRSYVKLQRQTQDTSSNQTMKQVKLLRYR